MQKFKIISALCALLSVGFIYAERPKERVTCIEKQSNREEIHPKKLPSECRMHIMKNYAGAEILKAFKLEQDQVAYAVKLQYKGQTIELQFDAKGRFLSRM